MSGRAEKAVLRPARAGDAAALLDIYAHYVESTAITFEYDVPSVDEFTRRIGHTLEKYPYIVAENGDGILGYAYAGPFHERAAYDWAVETSVYVKDGLGRCGLGRLLYAGLEAALAAQGIINANACIAYPAGEDDEFLTKNSVQFHEHMGYRFVGRFYKCGYKFGRWYDMVWMEKHLGPHPDTPAPVRPFPEIAGDLTF